MIGLRRAAVMAMMIVAGAQPAAAQDPGPGLRPKHLTVSGGVLVSGGYSLGDRAAEMRRNATGTPAPFELFRAESDLNRSAGVEARIGVALTRAFAVEVGGTFARPQLAVTIVQDVEGDATSLVSEDVSQYTVDVSGVFQLSALKLGARARPYVIAGVGYLRQLHEDRLLAETGHTVHAGGGVRYWLRGGAATRRALGVRADARLVRRSSGIDFDNKARNYPVVSLLGFAGF